ncbi:hypothetical protein [Cedecea sp. P7760]|jgi:hypothetical protein|uniref:hypothetical protein n=1 Tax=Cedecea TaxID=158483 RepID=UPI00159FAFA4|nr:hypothetical protein [Cedecea sp. P7760]NWC65499.1 hypothetical protein [Cedecea sp. P7760]
MKILAMLKALANGIHPETGEILTAESTANKPEAIRILFALIEELSATPEKQKKTKLTPEEKQQRNLAEGRPAKSYFPWTEEEKVILAERFGQSEAIEALGGEFGRSARAVAIQLEKMGLITAEQRLAYT